MRVLLLVALATLLPLAASAQPRGTCLVGSARAELDDGDVRAAVFNTGSLFFGTSSDAAQYVVPIASGTSPVYAANLWISGTVGGEPRTAGATYEDFAYRPGPLAADGTPPADCAPFDRIFVVSAADIAAYDAGGAPTPDLAAWPVAWGAEAIDGDGDPTTYDLSAGDRPKLYGTQTAFWVMNDAAAPASEFGLSTDAPIGVEVQVTAAAFGVPDPAFAQATLYRFRLVKRTPGTLDDARVALWIDTDLGNASDDHVGVDSTRGMAITYNADNDDNSGQSGYGLNPPAVGFDWLTGAGSHVLVGRGPGTPRGDAGAPEHLRNYSRGLWRDGTLIREGGTGLGDSGAVTPWVFAGDPVTGAFWSERNTNGSGASNEGGDAKQVLSSPALTLHPGVPVDVVLAIPFARGADHLDSITRLRAASDAIQAAYDANTLFPVAGETTAPAPSSALALSAPRPNPTAGVAEVTLTLPTAGAARVAVVDVLGREVAVVHAGTLPAGATTLRVPRGLAPGVYAVVAEATAGRAVQRLTVSR